MYDLIHFRINFNQSNVIKMRIKKLFLNENKSTHPYNLKNPGHKTN